MNAEQIKAYSVKHGVGLAEAKKEIQLSNLSNDVEKLTCGNSIKQVFNRLIYLLGDE